VKVVNAMDTTNAMAHTILFHQNTFNPSIMPKGMRLKTAMIALIHAPKTAMMPTKFCVVTAIMTHTAERTMLVKGPARAVFPALSFVTGPAIITAPGEMILKKGRSIEKRVISAPCIVNRNSAHNPKRCADNLWASSWRRKLKVNTTTRLTKISGRSANCRMKDKPTPMTSNAPRARCLSSVVLNQKTLAVGLGR